MKDWRYYLTKQMKVVHRCNKCGLEFSSFQEGAKHVMHEHKIEVELFTCEVCKGVFIKVVEGQKRCSDRICMFAELNNEGELIDVSY